MLRRSIIIPLVIIGAAAILLIGLRSQWATTEEGKLVATDDAYVRADQVPLSTRISGTVRNVHVGDYQAVTKGQLLVDLDDADFRAVLSQAKSGLVEAHAEFAANQDAKRAADAAIAAAREAIAGADAGSAAAKAVVSATQAEFTHAQSEYQRQEALLTGKAATQQQFEEAQAIRDRVSAEIRNSLARRSGARCIR